MKRLKLQHEIQHQPSWCLPACVAMVSAYFGIPVTQKDVAYWLGTTDIGTPSSRIERLSNRGYSVTYGEGSQSALGEWLSRNIPTILFVRTGELPYWKIDTAHAIVLCGLDHNEAIIIDPAVEIATCTVTIGDLMLAWSHFDYTFAALQSQK